MTSSTHDGEAESGALFAVERTRAEKAVDPAVARVQASGARAAAAAAARAGPHHRAVQPEGRGRQDDLGHQPGRGAGRGRAAGCCWSTSTRRARCRSGSGCSRTSWTAPTYNLLMERGVDIEDVAAQDARRRAWTCCPATSTCRRPRSSSSARSPASRPWPGRWRRCCGDYDYVLIDCQPSLGLLTVNALTAAHGVIIPLECEFFSLRGVALLIDTIEKVQERLNPDLKLDGILATMYDGRTLHGREVFARVLEAFGDTVFDTVISRTVRFPETTVAGEPITTWAPSSSGAKAYRAPGPRGHPRS